MLSTDDYILFNEINYLYVFGSSIVYGNDLKYPEQDSWVSVLGRLLKIPNVYNFGIAADGTIGTCLRTFDYIERFKIPKESFVLVMTSPDNGKLNMIKRTKDDIIYILFRKTAINEIATLFNSFNTLTPAVQVSYKSAIEFFYNLTIHNNFRNNKRSVKLLSSYLTYMGISYIIVPSHVKYDYLGDIKGYIVDVALNGNYKFSEKGHPLEEGNKAYAEYLYEILTETEE